MSAVEVLEMGLKSLKRRTDEVFEHMEMMNRQCAKTSTGMIDLCEVIREMRERVREVGPWNIIIYPPPPFILWSHTWNEGKGEGGRSAKYYYVPSPPPTHTHTHTPTPFILWGHTWNEGKSEGGRSLKYQAIIFIIRNIMHLFLLLEISGTYFYY